MPDTTAPNQVAVPIITGEVNLHDGSGNVALNISFDQTTDLPNSTTTPPIAKGIKNYVVKLYEKGKTTSLKSKTINYNDPAYYNSTTNKYTYQFTDVPDNCTYIISVKAYDNQTPNSNYTYETPSSSDGFSPSNNTRPGKPVITTPSSDWSNAGNFRIYWNAISGNGSISSIDYSVNGSQFAQTGRTTAAGTYYDLNTTDLPEGENEIVLRAVYTDGLTSENSDPVVFKKDTLNPSIELTNSNTEVMDALDLTGTISDVSLTKWEVYIAKASIFPSYSFLFDSTNIASSDKKIINAAIGSTINLSDPSYGINYNHDFIMIDCKMKCDR